MLAGAIVALGGCSATHVAGGGHADERSSQGQTGTATSSVDCGSRALATQDFRQIVQSAKDKVFPAVVFIKCQRESHESGRKEFESVAGSGVIISPTGEVLTNWHVVDKAAEIRCLLLDGTHWDAKVVGTDKDSDLALIQLEPSADAKKARAATTAPATPSTGSGQAQPALNLPFAQIGNSKVLKEGDFVMAMGAPWGLSRSVSIGIVSCTTRFLPDSSAYHLWLQTDAHISPGNSGGPLVNTNGQVIGINTLGLRGDMGFAIPSEAFDTVVDQLRKFHKMNWSWTGIQLQPLKDFDKNQYFAGDNGVMVAHAEPESPASRVGLKPGDRIICINGKAVNALRAEDLPAVQRTLGMLPKGEKATLDVMRDGKMEPIAITPREKGKVEGEELDCPRWDFTVKAINQFDNEDLYYYRKQGVFIYGIRPEGNAAEYGLHTQDIIVSIDGTEINSLDDMKKVHKDCIANIDKKHKVLFAVMRNGVMHQVMLDFLRDYQKE
jgi:serine protease Do